MKTVSQIAKECNTSRDYIDNVIKKEGIVKTGKLIDKYQEDHIHQILYFEGKITEIILESKINTDDVYS